MTFGYPGEGPSDTDSCSSCSNDQAAADALLSGRAEAFAAACTDRAALLAGASNSDDDSYSSCVGDAGTEAALIASFDTQPQASSPVRPLSSLRAEDLRHILSAQAQEEGSGSEASSGPRSLIEDSDDNSSGNDGPPPLRSEEAVDPSNLPQAWSDVQPAPAPMACDDCESQSASEWDEGGARVEEPNDEEFDDSDGEDDMESRMRERRNSVATSNKGRHSRDGAAKRKSHVRYAYAHHELVENYSIGRPCKASCPFGRQCGKNITPALLLRCHERSYGSNTTREQVDTEQMMADEPIYEYHCAFTQTQTKAAWDSLAHGFLWRPANDTSKVEERFMVEDVGPVCADYVAAAYGITGGGRSPWTWNTLLSDLRSGRLAARMTQDAVVGDTTNAYDRSTSQSQAETLEWWRLWLSLEDQMPNEPVIQHRTVTWNSVYEDEYLLDMKWWGTAQPLSRERWSALKKKSLAELSLQWFGAHKDDPLGLKPAKMLSLRERPSHSKFPPCPECEAAKAQWVEFRTQANRRFAPAPLNPLPLATLTLSHIDSRAKRTLAGKCCQATSRLRSLSSRST